MRRTWSFGVAFAAFAAVVLATASSAGAESDNSTYSPIKHTIILCQENISFDHYFGTYGHGVNGIPAGSTLSHTSGLQTWGPYSPTQLSGVTQSRTCDVDHGYGDMIKMANHGAMDQFLQFGNHKTVTNPRPMRCSQYPGISGAPCGEAGLGPRMPTLVISRFARQGFVDHDLLNTASLV